ncbi:MAG: PDZ domain-containing protein [Gammaproteobacteria bacterium]|nr:PDZ domain-containing protein [Gammaproteobacteria bacterium]
MNNENRTTGCKGLLVAAVFGLLAVTSFPASAQDPADADSDKDREAQRKELREAREALEQAARRVSELSRNMDGFDNNVRVFMRDLGGAPDRAVLGIVIGSMDGEDKVDGLKVLSVTPGGPADKAGLRSGDILVGLDGKDLSDGDEKAQRRLMEIMKSKEPGDEAEVAYLRGDDERSVTITTGESEPLVISRMLSGPMGEEFDVRLRGLEGEAVPEVMARFKGIPAPPDAPFFVRLMSGIGDMELVTLSKDLGAYFGTDKGLLVVRAPHEEAYKLKDGDVILEIDGREPRDPGHALKIMSSYEGGEDLELKILRNKKRQTVSIKVPEREVGMRWRPRPPEAPEPPAAEG